MKVLKAILALVGLVGLVAAGIYLGLVYIDNERLLAAANANKSGNLFPSPMTHIYISAGLGVVGGLLLGVGAALPLRTAGQLRRELEARIQPTVTVADTSTEPGTGTLG